MSDWENMIKDRLEEYESSLPEGSLADFQAKRNGVAATKKHSPRWFFIVGATAAAGLVTVLFLRQPMNTTQGTLVIQQPAFTIAEVPDTSNDMILLQNDSSIAQSPSYHPHLAPTAASEKKPSDQNITNTVTAIHIEKNTTVETNGTKEESYQESDNSDNVIQSESSLVIRDDFSDKPRQSYIGPLEGIALGGGLVAAVFSPMLKVTDRIKPSSNLDPLINIPENTETITHHMPLKIGLSTGFAISNRLNLRTSLVFSHYSSFFKNLQSKEKQSVSYLGIPLRLDLTLFSLNKLDVYLGGGIEGDYCLSAYSSQKSIKKDALQFSLIGTCGIQYHIAKRLSIYSEPELSLSLNSKNNNIETYRTQNKVSFSVGTGLRINIE